MTVQVIGKSALGRDMYGVVINDLSSRKQRRNYANWLDVRRGDAQGPAPRA